MTLKPANYKYRRTNGTSLTGGKKMGLVYAEIEISNLEDLILNRHGILPESEIRLVKTKALVDCGALDLVINEEARQRLDLPSQGKRAVKLADETIRYFDMVGPVEVRFESRTTIVNALVIPQTDEILLGAIPMEGLDVFIDPARERLVVNPESPDIPMSKVKRVA
ncbi:MAG TPA: aspartyl protease family protein [Pyrinomonadaceae bacterium]|jgi:clan AA aspartic protease|nr:aspartyl protease family protein [Pyrinomonadaceae bacterium]